MRQVRRLLAKISGIARREAAERDLEREVTSHLTLLADEFQRRGMTPEEARQAARREFGSVDHAKELSRDAWSLVWLEQAWQDLRHACRSLLHNPGFTLMAAITLALGIGLNATLFTAYNAVVLKPLPVADPDHVVRLERWYQNGMVGDVQYGFSYPEYAHCRDHNDVLAGLVAASWPIRVAADIASGSTSSETLQGELVSANYFTDLGIGAHIGRTFSSAGEGADVQAIVLSDSFWQTRFDGDPRVLGQTIVMNGVPFVIAGVAAKEFTGTSVGLQVPNFWAPLSAQKQLVPGEDWLHDPKRMQLQLLARLKPAMALKGAQAETDILIRQFGTTYQALDPTKAVTLQHTSFLGNTEDPRFQAAVAALMLTVGMILLAACANIANMLFARGVARQREIAIRLALGASRNRVVRHLLTESLLLSLIGGALGLVVSVWASKMLWVLARQTFSGPLTDSMVIQINLNPDIRVFAYTLLISMLAGVLFGISPALRSSRADVTTAIKDGGSFFGSRLSRSWLRAWLVAGQVTVSTLLLISAGMLTRGMIRSLTIAPGFETRRVLLLSANFGSTPAKAAEVQRRVMERLQTVREIRSVALGGVPLMGTWTPPILVEGPQTTVRGRTLAGYASDTYFDTLGIPLLRGRSFTRQEADRGAAIAVISESTARRFWPAEDPIGKRFQLDLHFRGDLTGFEVVGIAKDVRSANLTRIDPAKVYLPANIKEPYSMLVQAQGDIASAEAATRIAIGDLDKSLVPSVSLVTLQDGPMRIRMTLTQMLATFGAFLASLAMALAAVGIYGTMAFLVSQRVKEIGIRMALGATPGGVLKTVVAQGLTPVLTGTGFGILGAAGLSWALHASLVFPESSDLFYGVPFYDPVAFLGSWLLVASVAIAASALPAKRAIRVDPAISLRCE
jgi:predicted permease